MFKIIKKSVLSDDVCRFEIMAPEIANTRKPGQFVIIRLHEHGERVPFTIADSGSNSGTVTIIVQAVGKTTKELNAFFKVGDSIKDVVGPLGKATHIENFGTAVVVGGGLGIAVMYPIAAALKEAGNKLVTILGSRTYDLLILEKELSVISDELIVCTDDGSSGFHGFVTQPLDKMLKDSINVDFVIAAGPIPMMKNVANVTKPYSVRTFVSLNPIMVDGTGMCGACRVNVGGETKFACVDGPEFDAHLVDFDLLQARNSAYIENEKESLERFSRNS